VQADPASSTGAFVAGLLKPDVPVPATVMGGAAKRYAVYRNNVTISLIRAMESNFPVVRRLLGAQYFAGLAREFVQGHPPQSPLMFHYGDAFADYLMSQEDLAEFPYLHDIAKLEQQMRLAYHEADAPCLMTNMLTEVPEEALMQSTFLPHPAMALVRSAFAIHTIHAANQGDNTTPVVDITESQSVLVTRPLHDIVLHRLDEAHFAFFEALNSGVPFGSAAEAAFEVDGSFDLTSAISLLLMSGAFQSIITRND
jgi:hypothetical protein